MKIAFLGLGKMGVPLVKLLLRAGHPVTVWNRTPKALKELGIQDAELAPSITAAVSRCEVAFTMLADDEATEEVVFGPRGMIAALPQNAIHVALGTLGVPLSQRLASGHAEAGQRYVAAPVFGRPHIAAEGKLWILAAGDKETLERVRLILAVMGRGLTIIGEKPWQAHAAKLAGNMLMYSMIRSLSEIFVFASAQEIDLELFLKTVSEALFQPAFSLNYGRAMLHPAQQPGATVQLGVKDTRLFREAADAAGVHLGMANYVQEQLNAAIEDGMAEMDWTVAQYRMAEKAAKKNSSTDSYRHSEQREKSRG